MEIFGATKDTPCLRLRLRHEEVCWRQEHFGFVLYDRRTDGLYEGNHIGCEILRQIDDGEPVDAIGTALCTRYDIPPDRAASDVADFVQFLIHENLVAPW